MNDINNLSGQSDSLSEQELQAINGARARFIPGSVPDGGIHGTLTETVKNTITTTDSNPTPSVDNFTLDDLLPGYLVRRFPINLLVI